MIAYPDINPDLFHVGQLRVRWYGVMYVLGFFIGRQITMRLSRSGFLRLSRNAVDDLVIALFAGMLVGARLVYMFVYFRPEANEVWEWYTPLQFWKGGLSFHGAMLGMTAALIWFGRRHSVTFWNLADTVALSCSPGILLGRLGNFINAELWGRETSVPWAMSFPIRGVHPKTGDMVPYDWTTPRHPSQLYEAFGEGLLTLIIVWIYKRYARFEGSIAGVWISCYAVIRFVIEFFREKDEQLIYYFGLLTMGQILCILMFFGGAGIFMYSRRLRRPIGGPPLDETTDRAGKTADSHAA